MPINYSLPSFLRGNTPGELGQLAHAGATLELEKARLAQQAQEQQALMSVRAEQAAQAHEQAQAQMETEKAYHQIQTTLRQRELDQQNQMIQARTLQAAQKFQAQQQYQRAIEGGMDPEQAILEFGPAMGQSSSSVAIAQARATRPRWAQVPETMVEMNGNRFMKAVNPTTGAATYHPLREPKPPKSAITPYQQIQILQRRRSALTKDSPFVEGQEPTSEKLKSAYNQFSSELKKIDRQIEALQSGNVPQTSGTGTSGAKRFRYDIKTGKLEPIGEESPQSQETPEEE